MFPNVHIRYFAIHLKIVHQKGEVIKGIYDKLKADTQLKTVVLIGNQVGTFMQDAHNHGVDKFWILFTKQKPTKSDIELVVFNKYKLNKEILNIPRYQYTAAKKENNDTKKMKILKRAMENTILNYLVVITLMKDSKQPKLRTIRQYTKGNQTKLTSINDLVLPPNLMGIKRDEAVTRQLPKCHEVDIQKYPIRRKTPFLKQVDFYCKQCDFPYYKDGAGGCTLCRRNTIPFQNQTACYDSRVPEVRYTIVYVLDGLGVFLCLFILGVYFKYKHTPVVRSSHLFLSTAQVTCCLALFISFRLFSIPEPSVWLCTVRQTTTSLLLIAVASIVVCKAEQFLTICTMKTLIGKKKKRDLFVKQTLIFLFIMLTDCIVIVSSFPFPCEPRTIVVDVDVDKNKYTLTFCPTGRMSVIQVIYCILILLLSIVQALRGHNKLPDAYNDGNAIITSSATSACCLLFLVIYSAQEGSKRDFLSIINISLSISLLTLLISLYGMKIYVILFQPNKNTKCYIKTYKKSMEYVKARILEREDNAKSSSGKKTLVVQDSFSSSSSYEL